MANRLLKILANRVDEVLRAIIDVPFGGLSQESIDLTRQAASALNQARLLLNDAAAKTSDTTSGVYLGDGKWEDP